MSCEDGASEQNDPRVLAGVQGVLVPDAGLDLADVGPAQQVHAQPGLADAAADGEGELAGEEELVELELPPLIVAVSCLSRDSGETRMPMEESSKAQPRTSFHTSRSPLSAQSS